VVILHRPVLVTPSVSRPYRAHPGLSDWLTLVLVQPRYRGTTLGRRYQL